MYFVVSLTGMVIEEFRTLKAAKAYLRNAKRMGSPDGWLRLEYVNIL